jgi:hypothetical protein
MRKISTPLARLVCRMSRSRIVYIEGQQLPKRPAVPGTLAAIDVN